MERLDAVTKLKLLEGVNLHELAKEYGITVLSQNGKVNKGWAGQVLEKYLGIPLSTSRSPDFGSWELKSVPLKILKYGRMQFKETMAVTMIDPHHVARTSFEESHLLAKLQKAVLVARVVGSNYSSPSYVHSVVTLDLNKELYDIIKNDYQIIQDCIKDLRLGFEKLSSKMGVYIQPRTKGMGHGSKTRAFYARTQFLANFIKL